MHFSISRTLMEFDLKFALVKLPCLQQVMLDDVCAAYDALRVNKTPRLPMVRLQYPDFAAWQSRQLQSTSLLRQVRPPSHAHAGLTTHSGPRLRQLAGEAALSILLLRKIKP